MNYEISIQFNTRDYIPSVGSLEDTLNNCMRDFNFDEELRVVTTIKIANMNTARAMNDDEIEIARASFQEHFADVLKFPFKILIDPIS